MLNIQGYDGDTSSAGTLKSFSTRFGGSTASLDSESVATGARLTKRQSMILEGSVVEGPSKLSLFILGHIPLNYISNKLW